MSKGGSAAGRWLALAALVTLILAWAPPGLRAAEDDEGDGAVEVVLAQAPSGTEQVPNGAEQAPPATPPNTAEAPPPGQAAPQPEPVGPQPAAPVAPVEPQPQAPAPTPLLVGPPAPPGAEVPARPPQPAPDTTQAGNVADQGGAGAPGGVNAAEGRGEAGAEQPPDQVRTGPPAAGEGQARGPGYELTPEERAQLGLAPVPGAEATPPAKEELPPFANRQPGFIPDTEPNDLFAKPQTLELEFKSPLPPTALPDTPVGAEIQRRGATPGTGLDDNFARIVVPNGTIEGSTDTKQFHIEGGLLVYYSQVQITGETADIDEKNEVAVIRGSVTVADPEYTMKTDELRVYFKDKRMQAKGFVQFIKAADPKKSQPNFSLSNKDRVREYFAGQQFELYCTELFYNWETKELTALNSVRLVQPSFNGTMERIDYNDKAKTYEMSGAVVLEVTKYDWIFENKLAADEDEKRIKALTDSPTKITCDRMTYTEESGIAQFYAKPGAQVAFTQTGRNITANYIEVNDTTKDFYAEGSSEAQAKYTQTDGKWLFEGGLLDKDKVSKEVSDSLAGQLDATADTLTFNYDHRRLELKGNARVVAGERELSAAEVIQDETAKFFLMRRNVTIKDGDKNVVYAAQVYADTENDVFTFVGLVQGKAHSDELPATPGQEAGAPGFQAAAGVGQAGVPGQPGGAAANTGSANIAEGQ